MEEDRISETSYFLTLTYDDENKSIVRTRNGFLSLSKRHIQLFFKKLRKAHSVSQRGCVGAIKYYAVGEYGTRRKRPHYHIIIFNVKLELMFSQEDLIIMEYFGYDGKTRCMCHQWEHGTVTVGKVSGASVGYTLKYISKEKTIPMHRNDDRVPEFSLMSKRLGISYLSKEIIDMHRSSIVDRCYMTVIGGQRVTLPRYYKEKIYPLSFEREAIALAMKEKAEKKQRAVMEQFMADPVTFTRNHNEAVAAAFRRMHKQAAEDSKNF